jgi:plastocyanin
MKLALIALAVLLTAPAWAPAGSPAWAQGVEVIQEGRKFSESEVTIRQGESVTFTNHDSFTHNVYSKTPGMAFDLRTQKPGTSNEIKFDNAGEADVQCAIHPQMRMKVKVTKSP